MKKLTGLVIVLAVLVLGGYYGMGFLTEKSIKKNIEVINQSNGLFAEVEQYKRGLFCSDAEIKWNLHVPERVIKDANGQAQTIAAQDYQMETAVKIHHGPVIFANKQVHFGMGYAESVLPFPDQYKNQFDAQFTQDSVKPKLDLSIFVSYLDKSTVTLSIPSFKLINKDGTGQMDWEGMESTTSISAGIDKVRGGFVIDGLKLKKDDAKATLGKVTSDYSLHKTSAGLYLGEASFSLPSFVVLIKDQATFAINDFELRSNSDIENGLFKTNFNLALKSALVNGKNYGPGSLELSLKNLDADVLAQINEQATAMQNGTDAERQQAMLAMLPQLPKLFSKGAEFEISQLSMQLPNGLIKGSLLVSLPKRDVTNPFELLQKIKGNAKLKAPSAVVKQLVQQSIMQQLAKQPEMQQELVKQLQGTVSQAQANQPALTNEQLATMQTEKQLSAFEHAGLIVVQGSDYVVEVALDQGKFIVNSKPFDPLTMKF
ncbi:MAG: YdgA family protein [Legionellales bacterium]